VRKFYEESVKLFFIRLKTSHVKLRFMRQNGAPSWSATTAPHRAFDTVYFVVDSLGAMGTTYRETDVERTDLETVVADLIAGEFNEPIRVVASTRLSIGPMTFRGRSPKKFRNDATSRASPSPSASWTSLRTTPAQPGNWPCGWARELAAAESPSIV
jgi:hypothetical protein